jgi:predicted enzyme related to lactoylglutathione lyase
LTEHLLSRLAALDGTLHAFKLVARERALAQAQAAGGTLTAPAHMRPFGVYSGYFTDPDGHTLAVMQEAPKGYAPVS